MIFIKPVIFKTRNNNSYFYDDATGFVFPLVNEEEVADIEQLDSLEKLNSLKSARLSSLFKQYNLFLRNENQSIQSSLYLNERKKKGSRQLIIELTQNCNFRCKYCVFSDCYSEMRTFENKNAKWEIIQKAIDMYMTYNIACQKYNPTLIPAITFYGGEPLLEFTLIKKSIEYVKEKYQKYFANISYALTTNGYLLNEENIRFMLENNFFITISFDGNQITHDRNRVTFDGKGTFNKVSENVQLFERIARDYSCKYVFNTVIDCKEDIRNILSFFNSDDYLRNAFGKFSFVDAYNSTYYEGMNFTDLIDTRLNELFQIIEEQSELSQMARNMLSQIFLLFKNKINYDQKLLLNSCTIGVDKVMVDVNGDLYSCEKTNTEYKLGTVDTGLDDKKIIAYLDYISNLQKERCHQCQIRNLCDVCIKTVNVKDNQFDITLERCEENKKRQISLLRLYYYAKEKKYL